jgi:hypothetical protein
MEPCLFGRPAAPLSYCYCHGYVINCVTGDRIHCGARSRTSRVRRWLAAHASRQQWPSAVERLPHQRSITRISARIHGWMQH